MDTLRKNNGFHMFCKGVSWEIICFHRFGEAVPSQKIKFSQVWVSLGFARGHHWKSIGFILFSKGGQSRVCGNRAFPSRILSFRGGPNIGLGKDVSSYNELSLKQEAL